jgi:hypothetical protein
MPSTIASPRSLPARVLAVSLAFAVLPAWSVAEEKGATPVLATSPAPAEARLRHDVSFLADDAREGRAPGTAGIEAAADHIAAAFREAGLKTPPGPGTDGYFQPFTLTGRPSLDPDPTLRLAGPEGRAIKGEEKADFTPLAIGDGGKVEGAPIVFVGYGITAKDEAKALDYDDYNGLDVRGKAVLILRHEPRQDREDSPFDGKNDSRFAALQHKATNAFQRGAAAIVLVNDAFSLKDDGKDELLPFNGRGSDLMSPLPILMATRGFANKLLQAAGLPDLAALESAIDADLKPHSAPLPGWTLDTTVEIRRPQVQTRNVIGVLEGAGPLASETIVVGAHYDHLGRGGLFSGSLAMLSKEIHNGADDNASGTALVIELARRLARRADPLPRRVVFMAFSGEERGLLGSKHYVEHPVFPLSSTVLMANFDMVGRLNAKEELTLWGTGTTPGLDTLVDVLGKSAGFTVKKMPDGLGPSDQQSFYLENIPVVFAFTGDHLDYHRPSDDVERINFAGMARIADFAELLLLEVIRRPRRPEFVKVQRPGRGGGDPHASGDPGRLSVSAYLGSVPSYGDDVKGVKLQGVRPDSPADKGGLRGGDIVVGFGGKPVENIYHYTESLGQHKPGDTVEVVVQRDGKNVTLSVTLGRKPE